MCAPQHDAYCCCFYTALHSNSRSSWYQLRSCRGTSAAVVIAPHAQSRQPEACLGLACAAVAAAAEGCNCCLGNHASSKRLLPLLLYCHSSSSGLTPLALQLKRLVHCSPTPNCPTTCVLHALLQCMQCGPDTNTRSLSYHHPSPSMLSTLA